MSKPIGHMKFEDAIGILMNSTDTTMIAMHTEVHSMLLGVTRKGNSTGWHFYDPNFAVATFTSGNALLEATNKFFQRFAVVYEAKLEGERPAFNLFQIDADKVSRIGSDYNLTVADLVKPETLLETVAYV